MCFFLLECHLLGSDVCGYVWGKTDTRIKIPIKNIKDRQTYFGALDYQSQELIVREYQAGNSKNTLEFIQDLQFSRPGARIALVWDGASYHRSVEIQDFLAAVNGCYERSQWRITWRAFCTEFTRTKSGRRYLVTDQKFCEKILVLV